MGKTAFVYELSKAAQRNIRASVCFALCKELGLNPFTNTDAENNLLNEEIDKAINSRLCDLKELIDIEPYL